LLELLGMNLQHLIDKYSKKQGHYVYRLSYAGKFIIVKGKSLAGSLYFIQLGYTWFRRDIKHPGILYLHFYHHFQRHPQGRFRVKILLKSDNSYLLLKKEQQELDKHRYDKTCLNNAVEAYLPKYDEIKKVYGWIPANAALNFQKYLKSDQRKRFLLKYNK
jgi:hypothetical protein